VGGHAEIDEKLNVSLFGLLWWLLLLFVCLFLFVLTPHQIKGGVKIVCFAGSVAFHYKPDEARQKMVVIVVICLFVGFVSFRFVLLWWSLLFVCFFRFVFPPHQIKGGLKIVCLMGPGKNLSKAANIDLMVAVRCSRTCEKGFINRLFIIVKKKNIEKPTYVANITAGLSM